MRQLLPYALWIGNVTDAWDLTHVLSTGIVALVDLAANERPPNITRDLTYLRFPLVDGPGNPVWLLQSAANTLLHLLQQRVSTLVYCSAGMSRSPAIAAVAIALCEQSTLANSLARVTAGAAHDISPGLVTDLDQIFKQQLPLS